MPQTGTVGGSTGGTAVVSSAQLLSGLRSLAASGLQLGESKAATLNKMMVYARTVRPDASSAALSGLINSVYLAVQAEPGNWDKWIAGVKLPGEGALTAISNFVNSLAKAETYVRIGLFVGGAYIIILGLKQLSTVLGVPFPSGIPGVK